MNVIGKVIQVAGPAVDVEFPEGQIPVIRTAIRITSEGFNVPDPVDIICEVAQHIGENRVRTIALQPTEGMVRGILKSFTNTRHIIVNSDMVRREILEYFHFPAHRIHLVRNGIDLDRYRRGLPIAPDCPLHQALATGTDNNDTTPARSDAP